MPRTCPVREVCGSENPAIQLRNCDVCGADEAIALHVSAARSRRRWRLLLS